MRHNRLEGGLFIYSIVISTVLLIAFGATAPNLTSILTVALLFPLVAYFWIRLTNPWATDADVWSFRFMMVIAVLIFAGIWSFHEAKKNQELAAQTQQDSVNQQKITDLQQQLVLADAQQKAESSMTEQLFG